MTKSPKFDGLVRIHARDGLLTFECVPPGRGVVISDTDDPDGVFRAQLCVGDDVHDTVIGTWGQVLRAAKRWMAGTSAFGPPFNRRSPTRRSSAHSVQKH